MKKLELNYINKKHVIINKETSIEHNYYYLEKYYMNSDSAPV